MLYIENLCEFLCQIMLAEITQNATVLMPQNREWTKTSEMIEEIAKVYGKRPVKSSIFNPVIALSSKMSGKPGRLVNKAFGNMTYAVDVSKYKGINYQKLNLKSGIERTETGMGNHSKKEFYFW